MKRWILLSCGLLFTLLGIVVVAMNIFSFQQELSVLEETNEQIQIEQMAKIPRQYVIPDERYQDKEADPETIVYQIRPKKGEQFGSLVIPKLGLKLPLIEGTGKREWAKGIGHYRNSVLPGEKDTSVLAGHRETSLKRAGEIKKGDLLRVDTHEGEFIYAVTKMWIVDENNREVIVSTQRPIIRLVTCYPFDMLSTSTERYIIEAELVDSKQKRP